jgi:hypothetical protein
MPLEEQDKIILYAPYNAIPEAHTLVTLFDDHVNGAIAKHPFLDSLKAEAEPGKQTKGIPFTSILATNGELVTLNVYEAASSEFNAGILGWEPPTTAKMAFSAIAARLGLEGDVVYPDQLDKQWKHQAKIIPIPGTDPLSTMPSNTEEYVQAVLTAQFCYNQLLSGYIIKPFNPSRNEFPVKYNDARKRNEFHQRGRITA